MRFSAATALAALPLLASAAEVPASSPLDHIKASFAQYFAPFAGYVPHWNTYDPIAAYAAKASSNINILTLSNWKTTLRSSVTPASAGPEEWWILFTGGNKTCFGHCESVNKAFNETALLFKADPTAPHLAYVNCDHQPILCNSWATGPPSLYIMEVTPEPQPVTVTLPKFNTSSVNAADLVKIHATKSWKQTAPYNGTFHPFDGEVAKYGLAEPIGWFLWVFNVLPSWMVMLLVSFVSRGWMGSRLQPQGAARPGQVRPAGAAPAGTAPKR